MKCEVTTKSFDEFACFDFLIPHIEGCMLDVVKQLVRLDERLINIEGLNTIHVTENYREELFAFQTQIGHSTYVTKNEIGEGVAQVVHVEMVDKTSQDLVGFHVFFDKMIPMTLLIIQFLEDHNEEHNLPQEMVEKLYTEKRKYLMLIRHELSHIEDAINLRTVAWMKEAVESSSYNGITRRIVYRMWEEYYACKRSKYNMNLGMVLDEFEQLIENLDKTEKIICDLRWKYNTNEISLDYFVSALFDYVRLALIYCCYFAGHADDIYSQFIKVANMEQCNSRFIPLIPRLWTFLRNMAIKYPQWENWGEFDDLISVVDECIREFQVYPDNTAEGTYYSIPVRKLLPKRGRDQSNV